MEGSFLSMYVFPLDQIDVLSILINNISKQLSLSSLKGCHNE